MSVKQTTSIQTQELLSLKVTRITSSFVEKNYELLHESQCFCVNKQDCIFFMNKSMYLSM